MLKVIIYYFILHPVNQFIDHYVSHRGQYRFGVKLDSFNIYKFYA